MLNFINKLFGGSKSEKDVKKCRQLFSKSMSILHPMPR